MPFLEFDGAVDISYGRNGLFEGEAVFAYNTATLGGTSVERTKLFCISGNAECMYRCGFGIVSESNKHRRHETLLWSGAYVYSTDKMV